MPDRPVEIVCTACGADTLIRREPVYEGFKKTGERVVCTSCGHVFADEADVPFKKNVQPRVFSAEDMPEKIRVFSEDEDLEDCRRCCYYVVNPFTQRCGLHGTTVEATDWCEDFEVRTDNEHAEETRKEND